MRFWQEPLALALASVFAGACASNGDGNDEPGTDSTDGDTSSTGAGGDTTDAPTSTSDDTDDTEGGTGSEMDTDTGAGTNSGTAVVAVSGVIRDQYGMGIPSLAVVIDGVSDVTDGEGAFVIEDVTPPYDAVVIQPSVATIYRGLTRTDPTLHLLDAVAPARTATVEGTLDGGAGYPAAGYEEKRTFDGPGVHRESTVVNPTGGSYSLSLEWHNDVTVNGQVWVLQYTESSGSVTAYTGFGRKDVTISDGGTFSDQDFTMVDPPEDTFTTEVTVEGAAIFASLRIFLASNPAGSLILRNFDTEMMSYETLAPVIADTYIAAQAVSIGDTGGRSYAYRIGFPADATGATLSIPPPPTLGMPADAATEVDLTTRLQWTAPEQTLAFASVTCGGQTYRIFTVSKQTTLPDLGDEGVSLPTETSCMWMVNTYSGISDMDAATGSTHPLRAVYRLERIAAPLADGHHGWSETRSFTTAP